MDLSWLAVGIELIIAWLLLIWWIWSKGDKINRDIGHNFQVQAIKQLCRVESKIKLKDWDLAVLIWVLDLAVLVIAGGLLISTTINIFK